MIRRPPRSTQGVSSAASDVYKRQEVRLLCYDKTEPSYYGDIEKPILITLSRETPPHQFEACTILSKSLGDVRIEYVPGGHMGVITESGVVMPILADWLR